MKPEQRDGWIGRTVGGRYRVVRRIGQGGMSAVYEVAHLHLPRAFAMKVLAPELLGDADALARFRREADIVAGLRHPGIVQVTDWETSDDGVPCMIQELLHGQDLAARLEEGAGQAMGWAEIRRIADEVLAALSVTHRAGVVHRDLKPHNIFLAVDDSGQVRAKLLDFGISKVIASESVRTQQGQTLGTPQYMSPEQAEGSSDVGPETDVWAMGAILYELATGRRAFNGDSTPAVLYQICHRSPPPLSSLRPDAPAGFVEAVTLALTWDPERRLVEADDLRRRVAGEVAPSPPVVGRPWIAPVVAAVTVALLVALLSFVTLHRPTPVLAPPPPPPSTPATVTPTVTPTAPVTPAVTARPTPRPRHKPTPADSPPLLDP